MKFNPRKDPRYGKALILFESAVKELTRPDSDFEPAEGVDDRITAPDTYFAHLQGLLSSEICHMVQESIYPLLVSALEDQKIAPTRSTYRDTLVASWSHEAQQIVSEYEWLKVAFFSAKEQLKELEIQLNEIQQMANTRHRNERGLEQAKQFARECLEKSVTLYGWLSQAQLDSGFWKLMQPHMIQSLAMRGEIGLLELPSELQLPALDPIVEVIKKAAAHVNERVEEAVRKPERRLLN